LVQDVGQFYAIGMMYWYATTLATTVEMVSPISTLTGLAFKRRLATGGASNSKHKQAQEEMLMHS
jgi:hypothetical protein